MRQFLPVLLFASVISFLGSAVIHVLSFFDVPLGFGVYFITFSVFLIMPPVAIVAAQLAEGKTGSVGAGMDIKYALRGAPKWAQRGANAVGWVVMGEVLLYMVLRSGPPGPAVHLWLYSAAATFMNAHAALTFCSGRSLSQLGEYPSTQE